MTLDAPHMAGFGVPELLTERLRMRAPRAEDFDAYAAFCASPRSAGVGGPYARDRAWTLLCAVAGQWALRGYGRWLVADRQTDRPLGIVGLHHPSEWPEPEIGWSVFEEAEGRGVAFEAAVAARAYAYGTLGWPTVMSLIADDNPRSAALAKRMGATPDGVFRHPDYGPLNIWRHQPPEALA